MDKFSVLTSKVGEGREGGHMNCRKKAFEVSIWYWKSQENVYKHFFTLCVYLPIFPDWFWPKHFPNYYFGILIMKPKFSNIVPLI